MNTEDSHEQIVIFKLDENDLPEIFDLKNQKINLSLFENPEYINKITDKINNVDFLALPTSLFNPLLLPNIGLEETDCEKLNSAAALAFKNKGIKLAAVIGRSNTPIDPFGEASFTELIASYDRQVKALEDHTDLFLIDGIDSMTDMRAAILSCKKTDKQVLVNIVGSDNLSPLGGLITAQEMGTDGFGAYASDDYEEVYKELVKYAKIPLIGDISSKEKYLICKKSDYFSGIEKKTVNKLSPEDDFFVFTHFSSVFFLEADTTEISEPIKCCPDMEEEISAVCNTSCDILRVEINSSDDAIDFARNAHMSTRPVMFLSDDILALKMALMLYQGMALIDSSTLIPKEELENMCKKYGAVVY